MAAVREEQLKTNKGLVLQSEWRAQQERRRTEPVEDDEDELTEEEQADLEITTYCRELLRKAVRARRPFETFDKVWDLFKGVMFPPGLPKWRGKIVLNKIRVIVLFLQAAMTDNKPRINIQPAMPGTEGAANLIGKLVDREWDRTGAQAAHSMAAFYGLVFGSGFVKWGRDPTLNGGRGGFFCEPVVPYRLFFNPGCRNVRTAEYIIQHERLPLGWIARHFKKDYKKVKKFAGGTSDMEGQANTRDLVQEGSPDVAGRYAVHTAMNMNGNTTRVAREGSTLDPNDRDLIDVYEFWLRDDATEEYDTQVIEDGHGKVEAIPDPDGGYMMERAGGSKIVTNPVTGQPMVMPALRPKMRKVMKKAERPRYPNGRTVLMAGPVKLRDIPNPYECDGFPYADWRDVDFGSVWGEGEPLALKDANIGMNRTATMTYDNLNLGGQLSWLVSKTSGISPEQIKNRPAAIFPVEDVNNAMKAVERPSVSGEFLNLYNLLDKALPGLAGLNDAIMGGAPPANTAFATVDNLTEQGAATIRLRVRNFEGMFTRSGEILASMIQQFSGKNESDNDPIRREEIPETRFETVPGEEGEEPTVIAIVPPASAKRVEWDFYTKAMLSGRIELSVTPDSSLATSPAGMFNKLMTLLDKKVVDPQYVGEKLNLDDFQEVLLRMRAEAALAAQAKKKPGPKPGAAATKEGRAAPPPTSHVPTRAAMAAVR